jgi:hypothetical protein
MKQEEQAGRGILKKSLLYPPLYSTISEGVGTANWELA